MCDAIIAKSYSVGLPFLVPPVSPADRLGVRVDTACSFDGMYVLCVDSDSLCTPLAGSCMIAPDFKATTNRGALSMPDRQSAP